MPLISKTIDGVTFELKGDFDFAFLKCYGELFAVFDKQDSGNLCFGVQTGRGTEKRRRFLKLAGAATTESQIDCKEAVRRMRSTVAIYADLRHPALIELIEHMPVPGGYLTVFEWFEGECMGRQYRSYDKFIALSVRQKLDIYAQIVRFHIHANTCGYIAIDFYDGCIMYDFAARQTRLCDIELYSRKPVVNTMGRMWGSSRFMSPEEFQLGAEIDERSNVFLMGATAFQLFGGGQDRSAKLWQATEQQYATALRAVSGQKADRYATIAQFFADWTG